MDEDDWTRGVCSHIVRTLSATLIADDILVKVIWVACGFDALEPTRLVWKNEKNEDDGVLTDLWGCALKQSDILSFDVCEAGFGDLRKYTLDLWTHVAADTGGLLVENGNRLQLSWLPPVVVDVDNVVDNVDDEKVVKITRYELEAMTVKQLKVLCQEHGLRNTSALRKAALIDLLEKTLA